MDDQATKLSEGKQCPACGVEMGRALTVCWTCWRSFKNSGQTLDEFVAKTKREKNLLQ